MTTYQIKATRGQYLRTAMESATPETVEATLLRAAEYVGYPHAEIVECDNGNYVAYENEAHAAADVGQGGSADPILIATAMVNAPATVWCHGCGDEVPSADAIWHGGEPYCAGCDAAPVDES